MGQKALKLSAATVDIYVRIANDCPGVEHVGKKKHSTKARDTAVRSFRAVSTFIAVVLASQSYAVVESEWVYKKIKGNRDVNDVFPYPVNWVNPALLLNTDETTLVLMKNKVGKLEWTVVSKR